MCVWDWKIGTDKYIPLYIKQITNKTNYIRQGTLLNTP